VSVNVTFKYLTVFQLPPFSGGQSVSQLSACDPIRPVAANSCRDFIRTRMCVVNQTIPTKCYGKVLKILC